MTEPQAAPLILNWEDYLPRVGQEGIPLWRRQELAREMALDEQRLRMRMSPPPAPPSWTPGRSDVDYLFRTAIGKAAGDPVRAAELLQAWRNDSQSAAILDYGVHQLLVAELKRLVKTKPKK